MIGNIFDCVCHLGSVCDVACQTTHHDGCPYAYPQVVTNPDRPYCVVEDCDEYAETGELLCEHCADAEMEWLLEHPTARKLTRQERLQALADAGYDTLDWEDR